MKNKTNFILRQLFLVVVAGLLMPSVSLIAQDKKKTAAPVNTFVYNNPVNKPLSYVQATKIIQNMEINGQAMQTNVSSSLAVTIKSLGPSGTDSKIEFRIDSMSQNVESPAGSMGGSIDGVKGKSFNIIVSGTGKITDVSEAAALTYDAGNGAQADASTIVDNFFPVLPAGQITPGYKWSSTDSINSKTPTVTTTGVVTSENTFDGYETYKGLNCAKFSSVLTGTRIIKTQSQGMDIKVTGPYNGTVTVYYAPAEGYFVKQDVTSKMNGTIEVSAAEGMTFPIIMDTTVSKELK